MLRREFVLVLFGAATIILGGALFLNSFGNEPMWVEWLLGPAVAFVGLMLVIVGVALYCYAAETATDNTPPAMTAAKQSH